MQAARFAIGAAIILLLVLYLAIMQHQRATSLPSSFTFSNVTYRFSGVEVTLQQQEHGLMNATVTNSTFLLFVFNSSGVYPFWMKDTDYPLDIIWINGTKVVYIANATPCSWYSPNQNACTVYNSFEEGKYANYVIEAQSGFANRTGIKIGSTISIN